MTFSELRERTRALCWVGGWSEVQPPPNWALLVRQGHRTFFWEAQVLTNEDTFTTVADTAEYKLTAPPDWIALTDVIYDGKAPLVASSEASIRRMDPLWLKTPSSTPLYWWITEPNTIRLWPAPITSNVVISVRGYRMDDDLVDDMDVPSCPDIYHEAIALFAAWHHGKLYSRGEDRIILENYLAEARAIVERCREYFASNDSTAFVRRVRAKPGYEVRLG